MSEPEPAANVRPAVIPAATFAQEKQYDQDDQHGAHGATLL